jgi:hypothetical protein
MVEPFTIATVSINVRPSTMLVLKRAQRLYESIASGDLKVYAGSPAYKFHDPDLVVMRDTADELSRLIEELDLRVKEELK